MQPNGRNYAKTSDIWMLIENRNNIQVNIVVLDLDLFENESLPTIWQTFLVSTYTIFASHIGVLSWVYFNTEFKNHFLNSHCKRMAYEGLQGLGKTKREKIVFELIIEPDVYLNDNTTS